MKKYSDIWPCLTLFGSVTQSTKSNQSIWRSMIIPCQSWSCDIILVKNSDHYTETQSPPALLNIPEPPSRGWRLTSVSSKTCKNSILQIFDLLLTLQQSRLTNSVLIYLFHIQEISDRNNKILYLMYNEQTIVCGCIPIELGSCVRVLLESSRSCRFSQPLICSSTVSRLFLVTSRYRSCFIVPIICKHTYM